MAISLHVALTASVVITGADLSSTVDFAEKLLEITQTDVHIMAGDVEGSEILVLDRERIGIVIQELRLVINRDYPAKEDLPALARISSATLDFHGQAMKAIGYNVELVFEQDSGQSAERYLGQRLFIHKELGSKEWPLWGGDGRMVFGHSQKRKSFTITPRQDDEQTTRLYVEANYHVADGRIPCETEINKSLVTIWEDAHKMVERIDLVETL